MTLKKCPSCGHQHDSADTICPYCKHSYSNKKYICDNCGAYLQPTDKICYVCGRVIEQKEAVFAQPPVVREVSQEEPVMLEETEDINTYIADENDDFQPDFAQDRDEPVKKKSKKPLVITLVAIIFVALIAGGVGLCYFQGWLPKKEEAPVEEKNITLYFEKPMANQNLMTSDGTVYNWTGDVDINYTLDGKKYTKPCKMTEEYDNIWYKKIPEGVSEVYFSETGLETVRTQNLKNIADENIYFVTDILFDENIQLPVDGCAISDFNKYGINYTTAPTVTETKKETEASTEKETEASQAETEADTAVDAQPYTLAVPQQWQDKITVIENGNCISYYDTYNYSNYGCGHLLSVYVFDADDTSYSQMNVEKVVTTSDGVNKVVAVTPTDVQFYESDDKAAEGYIGMSNYTDQVIESIKAK